ncbi:MAG: heme ABC exporter, ATP-binding protein CcmA [Chloroflexi bacterium RBG_16_57_9]|nr:MAG: heme ABC exporter, ATP-binding protein CcmA [Chloroflexi bacterium RBG_16_57_9]
MIAIRKVSKRFGSKWALRDVNLDLAQGEFLSLFGPNGAGKTTLMRIIATLSKPTSGAVTLNGVPTTRAGGAVRHQLGLVSHQTLLYPDLTAQENLQFFGRMYDVPALPDRVNEVLDLVGLFARRHDPVRTYSRGMQQRLAIARAIIHDPGIMLLDEPYTGLDPHAAEILRGVLQRLVFQDRTVIMTTHDLERGLELCDRVAILANGRIAFEARREEIDVEDFANIYRDHVAA